jgi:DNA polymerase-3 subunit alpha
VTQPVSPFVHLRVHSAYSLLEGALTIERLAALAVEHRMPALALTDSNNLFGALEFSEALSQACIQPIVGCTLSLSFFDEEKPVDDGAIARRVNHGRIALLAKNDAGYANLIRLSTDAYAYGADSGDPIVTVPHLMSSFSGTAYSKSAWWSPRFSILPMAPSCRSLRPMNHISRRLRISRRMTP